MSKAAFTRRPLDNLPVELLYEVQLFALSEYLPYTCHRLRSVYTFAPNSFLAQYILGRFHALPASKSTSIVTRSLRYALCTQPVFEAIIRHPDCPPISGTPELPKRLFRSFARTKRTQWSENDEPLPFLRHLYQHSRFPPPDADAHEGYALTKAVAANFVPLVRFLLTHDASPGCKDALPVMIAIQRKDLSMVRLLIETGYGERNAKKRKLPDRIPSTARMLKKAVKCGARDIARYFVDEKGVIPDMQTIQLLANIS